MKKLFLMLIVMLIAVGAFANGQTEKGANGPQDGTRPMTQSRECYVDGEFSMDLFLENSPIVAQLDADGDGIVDGTDVTVEDFMSDRVGDLPMQRMQGGRMSNRGGRPARGQGRN